MLNLYGRAIHEASEVPHRYLRGPKRGVLNWQALRSAHRLVVAESVLDALSLWQAGVRDVTCLFGAGGLPPDLEEQLARSPARELVWCLDADPAGRTATADLARQLTRFSSQSVELPEGQDPNQVLTTQGAAELARRVAAARPLDRPGPAPAQEAQEDPESLTRELEGVRYHLTPLPPFYGRLKVVLRAERDGRHFAGRLDFLVLRMLDQVGLQLGRRLGLSKEQSERHLSTLMKETESWRPSTGQACA